MYPPAPGNFRMAAVDFEFDGVKIPKGTSIFWNVAATNYDDAYYVKPFEFRPERWIESRRPPATALPTFGAGSRDCAGKLFARQNIKTFMSVALRGFSWNVR